MQEEDWALSMFMFETKNVIQCECLICQGAAWQTCCNLDFVMEEGVDDPMDDPMGDCRIWEHIVCALLLVLWGRV